MELCLIIINKIFWAAFTNFDVGWNMKRPSAAENFRDSSPTENCSQVLHTIMYLSELSIYFQIAQWREQIHYFRGSCMILKLSHKLLHYQIRIKVLSIKIFRYDLLLYFV